MGYIEILFIGVGLAMDAFAVSICKGLSMKKFNLRKAITVGMYFGVFQAIMPCIGFSLGIGFEDFVKSVDHWIAFFLLMLIGVNMIIDMFKNKENSSDDVSFKTMTMLAVATSIDALAVGITFAFLGANIFASAALIGVITFCISMIGVLIRVKVWK